MPEIIMICGRICCGKTTYVNRIKKRYSAVVLSCDELMLSLFEEQLGDSHETILEKVKNYLYQKAEEIVEAGSNVILDFGFWTRQERMAVKKRFQGKQIPVSLHYLQIEKTVWQKHVDFRNERIQSGKETGAYYIDHEMQHLFWDCFEEPEQNEINVWHKVNQ